MDGAPGAADALDVEHFDVVLFGAGEEVRHPLRGAVDAGLELTLLEEDKSRLVRR